MVMPAPSCGSCGKTFSGREARDQHLIAKGHSMPPHESYFCCGSCKKDFSDWLARDTHCAMKGHEKPPNECERCSLWFQTQAEVDEHMAAANHWPYVCRYCQSSYQTEDRCETHEAEEHTSGHLFAPAGDVQQVNSNAQRSSHGPSLTSVGSVQSVDWLPSQHADAAPSTAANDKPASFRPPKETEHCGRCERSFANTQGLRDHERAFHGMRFKCQQCGEGFETKSAICKHTMNAPRHGVDCPYCQNKFHAASILCHHLESGKCEGKGETARHLDYYGLYQLIRFKDPFENLTTDHPNWTGQKLTGKSRLYFYHCPNMTCKKKFKTLEGAMGHLEDGWCKFATREDVCQKICPDIIHGFKFLGLYPIKGRK